ncbi:nuclear transport factor 2 family protein [Vibrio penaeicida]|uniref:SnoaL-like domain-containing protein n=1 Tax=Vibrio penaeicida TaxID=104609 RepID=A0AAV5NUY2_9VIBR|nr:nuclear transport factor 2 family protein [Vibrio penaeicida]RTZ19840.1 hypothetical protein EKN09_26100 [Vibrio penaeicida]GLQ74144.1 hypothetical protein GCM10007932_35050 [Vibrio penaeicida]
MSKKLILSSLIMASLSGAAVAQNSQAIVFPGESNEQQRSIQFPQHSQAQKNAIVFPSRSYANQSYKGSYQQSKARQEFFQTMESVHVAEGFYTDTLINRDYNTYYDYIGEVYVQHAPDYPDGAEPLRVELLKYLDDNPNIEVDILRTIAEKDYVAIHSAWTNNGSTDVYVDIWRVEDGKLVEHWDHYQGVESSTELSGPEVDMYARQNPDLNRTKALRVINTYNDLSDLNDVRRFVDANFVGHTPEAQNGKGAFINHLQGMAQNGKRFVRTPAQTIAMGDMVLVHSKQVDRDVENDLGTGYIDIFRFNNQGKIVEQWSVEQKVKPVDERYNINEIFAYPYRW